MAVRIFQLATHIKNRRMPASGVAAIVVFSAAGAAQVAAAVIRVFHMPLVAQIQLAHQLPEHCALRSESPLNTSYRARSVATSKLNQERPQRLPLN